MKITTVVIWVALVLVAMPALSQKAVSVSYEELKDPKPFNQSAWANIKPGNYVSFASADIRYKKMEVPGLAKTDNLWETKAWKGEKVHTQFLIWTTAGLNEANLEWGDLTNQQRHKISGKNIRANFVRYVMTDALNEKGSGCGMKNVTDSSLVEDLVSTQKILPVQANTTQPVWLSIAVPATTPAGMYKGVVKVKNGNKVIGKLDYSVEVVNRVLPQPKDWQFHLDLWQNPYAIARVHGVKPWSGEHMKIMHPYMKMLADAGQKTITATIFTTHGIVKHKTYMVRWLNG